MKKFAPFLGSYTHRMSSNGWVLEGTVEVTPAGPESVEFLIMTKVNGYDRGVRLVISWDSGVREYRVARETLPVIEYDECRDFKVRFVDGSLIIKWKKTTDRGDILLCSIACTMKDADDMAIVARTEEKDLVRIKPIFIEARRKR